MKEKIIFAAIILLALVGIGVVIYRTSYQQGGAMYAPETKSIMEEGTMRGAVPATSGETMKGPITPPSVTAPTTPPPATSNGISSGIIRYTESGFAPVPLTVKAGTMVVFKNEGSTDVWPASAPHPTHTDYPGFDALKPIKPGQSYSFTFMRVGTWKYHNHLNPRQYGSVVVE